jgi:hypothetical protein
LVLRRRRQVEKVSGNFQTPPENPPERMPFGTTRKEREILVVLAILIVLGVIGIAVL